MLTTARTALSSVRESTRNQRTRSNARGVIVAAVVCLSLGACGSGSDDAAPETATRKAAAVAFSAPMIPDGYAPRFEGRGRVQLWWGSDDFGSTEPFTVLAPAGAGPESPDAVVVSTTGFAGYQGGLDQAAASYSARLRSEELDVDGRRAIYTPRQSGEEDLVWADLVAEQRSGGAIRVTSRTDSRRTLLDVLGAVDAPTAPRSPRRSPIRPRAYASSDRYRPAPRPA